MKQEIKEIKQKTINNIFKIIDRLDHLEQDRANYEAFIESVFYEAGKLGGSVCDVVSVLESADDWDGVDLISEHADASVPVCNNDVYSAIPALDAGGWMDEVSGCGWEDVIRWAQFAYYRMVYDTTYKITRELLKELREICASIQKGVKK